MSGKIYLEIAKNCLNNWYPDMPEEQKTELLERGDFDELESYIGAEASIRAAIEGLNRGCCLAHLPDYFYFDVDGFMENAIRNELRNNRLKNRIERITYDSLFEDLDAICLAALVALETIHTQWVRDNTEKYFDKKRRDKRFMFMPISFIGWEEVKKDLIFLKPILKVVGLDVAENLIEELYVEMRTKMLSHRGEDLWEYIIYIVDALEEQGVDKRITRSIRRKDVAQKIAAQCLAAK